MTLFEFSLGKYHIKCWCAEGVNERVKRLYDRRKAKGECLSCGKEVKSFKEVKGGRVRMRKCDRCRERQNSLRRK